MEILSFEDFQGNVITSENLPPKSTTRWVANRKYILLMAVETGMISEQDCFLQYGISEEEFCTWKQGFEKYGRNGLLSTRARERLRGSVLRDKKRRPSQRENKAPT